jgi:hypothetical protein
MSALGRHTLPDSGVHFSCEQTAESQTAAKGKILADSSLTAT